MKIIVRGHDSLNPFLTLKIFFNYERCFCSTEVLLVPRLNAAWELEICVHKNEKEEKMYLF
jgi:hypothetical protein